MVILHFKIVVMLEIEIDKLTNSIENVVTGDSFPTDVLLLSQKDLKSISKSKDWRFDWKKEFKTLGAVSLGGLRMAIFEDEATKLVHQYYKNS
jgi:hypothetical protein